MSRDLTERDIREGFWYYRPEEQFPPRTIRDPEDYDGGERLALACTQTELPPREQTKLVKRWCEVLPTLAQLKFLWLHSHVTQKLFDAACMAPNLEGLYVKWSNIKTINAIESVRHFRYFHLGSSTRLESLEPLRSLKNLVWLELENIKRITNFELIAELQSLQGLELSGSMWTAQVVDSLAPIGRLKSLRHLYLLNLRAKDKTLKTLLPLKTLERFLSATWWTEDEVRQLYDANPKLPRADFDHFVSANEILKAGMSK